MTKTAIQYLRKAAKRYVKEYDEIIGDTKTENLTEEQKKWVRENIAFSNILRLKWDPESFPVSSVSTIHHHTCKMSRNNLTELFTSEQFCEI